MCNVTILAPFRDRAECVAPYRERIESLEHPYAALRVVVVEGDSVDQTWVRVWEWAAQDSRVRVVTCHTGKPRYGSVVNADRFAGLAQVFNAGFDAVDLEWSTHVLMLPSDIDYKQDMLRRLLAHGVDLVSPIVWLGERFYDLFAFIEDGRNWTNFPRATWERGRTTTLIPMDSVGGVLLMRAEVVRAGCRYAVEDVDRGLCRTARERGFRVWADPSLSVLHP